MADFTSARGMGGYDANAPVYQTSTSHGKRLATLTNFAGAAISLALVAGVAVWGYKLLMRDVSGIPVVRAVQGEMRIKPEEPGGQLARNQGLAVNAVAAEGVAAAPADALKLAPKPVDLTDEDMPAATVQVAAKPQVPQVDTTAPASEQLAEDIDVAAALQSGNVGDLVARLTDGVDPLEQNFDETIARTVAAVASVAEVPQVENTVLEAPGVRQSLRPRHRPAAPARVIAASVAPEPNDVDAAALPAGTRLAQLGAFDSPDIARTQWTALNERHGPYLEGKDRVIQKATSGGRVFYRLRAMGFDDLADARRFCSALVAEGTDCIPVVTR